MRNIRLRVSDTEVIYTCEMWYLVLITVSLPSTSEGQSQLEVVNHRGVIPVTNL
jgi:hypothetical protein